MTRFTLLAPVLLTVGLCAAASLRAGEAPPRVVPLDLTAMKHKKDVHLTKKEDGVFVWELPKGGGEELDINIEELGFDPREYDELRYDLFQEGSLARVMMMIKAFPEPDLLRSWYSKTRTEVGQWHDCRFDLHVDDDGFWFKTKEPYTPSLEIKLDKRIQGLPGEPNWRKATIRNPRFVRRMLGLSFDHMGAEIVTNHDEVTYTYTLRIENKTKEPLEAALDADSDKSLKYFTVDAPATVSLKPGETKEVPVRLSIPRNVAMTLPPLYSESIVPRVEVPGVADSDTVSIMGYRRWPMWAVVPIFHQTWWTPAAFQARLEARKPYIKNYEQWEKKLLNTADGALGRDYPLPPPELMPPGYIMNYRCPECKGWLKPAGHATFRKHWCDKCKITVEGNAWIDRAHVWRYLGDTFSTIRTLSQAWLLTGKDAYAEKAVALFEKYADAYPDFPMSRFSSTAGGAKLNTTTLYSCFIAMPLPEAFAYLHEAPALTPEAYDKIRAFLLDEAGRVARHCVYDSNMTAEHIRFYGSTSLATGYWPLAGEAIYGEFGWHEMVDHAFSEDGIGHEAGAYHRSIFHAMLGFAEFAHQYGVNLLTARFKRVFDGTLQIGAAGGDAFHLAYEVYRDPQYLRTVRDAGVFCGALGLPEAGAIPVQSQVLSGAGYVFLRKGNMAGSRQIRINYKNSFDRTEHDRFQTKFYHGGRVDDEVNRIMYSDPNAKWMYQTAAHSTIVIDGKSQNGGAGRLLATDFSPDAPVAVVATTPGNELYEGVTQVRGIALVGDWFVVFDRVQCENPSIIDRYQYGAEPIVVEGEAKAADNLSALPEAGKFKNVQGVASGKEVLVRYGKDDPKRKSKMMKMRVVSDQPMTAYVADTFGKWFGHAMKSSFIRTEGKEATFLAAFSDGDDSTLPKLNIDRSDEERLTVTVTGAEKAWTIDVDLKNESVGVTQAEVASE